MSSDRRTVWIAGATCEAHHQLSPAEFSDGVWLEWPIECSEELARQPLLHPGCNAPLELHATTIEDAARLGLPIDRLPLPEGG